MSGASDTVTAITGILVGVLGLSVIAVLVSQKAQTSGVIGAATSGFAAIVSAATSPITGQGSVTAAPPPSAVNTAAGGAPSLLSTGGASNPLSLLGTNPTSLLGSMGGGFGSGAFGF
jgi:hypothetical protein